MKIVFNFSDFKTYNFFMTLVWLTSIVFQKKKKVDCSSTKPIVGSENDVKNVDSSWRKCLHLFNLFCSKLFRKNELWFSFFIRNMKSIFPHCSCVFDKHRATEENKSWVYVEILKKVNFFVKTFSKKWIIIFIFCENYESYYFVIILVFLKKTVFKKKKKCRFYIEILKKVFTFSFFF